MESTRVVVHRRSGHGVEALRDRAACYVEWDDGRVPGAKTKPVPPTSEEMKEVVVTAVAANVVRVCSGARDGISLRRTLEYAVAHMIERGVRPRLHSDMMGLAVVLSSSLLRRFLVTGASDDDALIEECTWAFCDEAVRPPTSIPRK